MKPKLMRLLAGMSLAVVFVAVLGWSQEEKKPTSGQDLNAHAVNGLRVINTSEVTYASTYNKGFSPTLAALGETPEGVQPSESRSNLIDNDLAKGRKQGYIFVYKPGPRDKDGKISTYTITARPAKWHQGLLNFFSDQTGVIRLCKENRLATAKDPPIGT